MSTKNSDSRNDWDDDRDGGRGFDLPGDRGFDLAGDRGFDLAGDRGFDLARDRGFDLAGDRGFDPAGDRGFDLARDRGLDLAGDRGFDLGRDRGLDLPGDRSFDRQDGWQDSHDSGGHGRPDNVGHEQGWHGGRDEHDDGGQALVGTNGNDTLIGTADDDKISGRDGDDNIDGGKGDDKIDGGDGDDSIDGGDGDDKIDGGDGDDSIDGGKGDDKIDGGDGDDSIDGGGGDDNIDGGKGDDYIDGGSGDDRLDGGQGDDTLVGGAGNDYIDGSPHGLDTAIYSGNYLDYQITFSGGPVDSEGYKITVVDKRDGSPDGTDTLRRIEVIRFADGEFRDGQFIPDNTPATIGNPTAANVTEDADVSGGLLVATGAISVSDPDPGQAVFQTTVLPAPGTLGTLSLAGSGSYTYTVANSDVQYLGASDTKADSFTIASADGTTKVVSFTIHGTNDAAVISGIAAGTVVEAGGVNNANTGTPTVSGQLSAADVDNLAEFAVVSTPAAANHGTYTIDVTGHWSYTLDNTDPAVQALNATQTLTDNFTVTTADGTAQLVTITIGGANDAAVIGTPTVSAVTEDVAVVAGILKATGSISISDAEANQSTFQTAVTGALGNLGSLGLGANGSYLYTVTNSLVQYLGATDSKVDSFTITSADGTDKVVSFTINGTNDAAMIGAPTVSAVTEDVGVSGGNLTATGSISVADADAGQGIFSTAVSAVGSPVGSLLLATNGVYTYTVVNGAVQQLGAGVTATDTFRIASADGTTKDVSFTINGANDAPALTGAAATLAGGTEDSAYSVSLSALLSGFTDVDGDTLSVTGLAADHGAVTDNGNGTYTITPSANYNGTVVLSYAVSDGHGGNSSATQHFSLAAMNDAPVAVADNLATTQDTAVTYAAAQLLANDSDGDPELTQALTIATLTSGIGGTAVLNTDGSVTFTPTPGFNGPANFTYTVGDGALSSAPATVTVDVAPAGNGPPVFAGPAATLPGGTEDTGYTVNAADLLAGYMDPDGDAMSVRNLAADHGTVADNGNGSYTITPSQNYFGSVGLSYTVSDGHGGNTPAAQSFSLAPVNDPAVITGTAAGTVAEDGVVAGTPTASGQLGATDVDSSAAFTVVSTPAAATHGTYTIDATGHWSYTLNNAGAAVQALNVAQTLTDSFTATTADGTQQVVSIAIVGANDAPGLAAPAAISYTDSQAADTFAAVTGTLVGADVDSGATLTYGVSGGALSSALAGYDWAKTGVYGTLYLNSASGAYRFVAGSAAINAVPADANPSDSFTLTVSDGAGGTHSQALSVNVTGENDAAVISGVSGPLAYTVGQSAVLVAPTLTLGDADSGLVTSATVAISGGFSAGNDILAVQLPDGSPITARDEGNDVWTYQFPSTHEITATFVAGELMFTGAATLAEYQSLLDSVTFHTTIIGGRTISFTVFDGTIASITVNTSNVSLEDLTTTGFNVPGEAALDGSGNWVSTAGDVNGDGYADMIIGAPWADAHGDFTGRSYVIFGKPSGFGTEVPLWSIDGSNGLRLSGEGAVGQAGFSVSTAGDLNGDGFADMIIGAPYVDGNAGASYVVFGRASFSSVLDSNANAELSALGTPGSLSGFRLSGEAAGDKVGLSVSGAGDVNGDGFADVIVGAPYAGPYGEGASYVVFGSASGFAAATNLSDLDSSSGFRILGEASGDTAGMRVSAAGDVNGDGFADVIVGAPFAGPNGTYSGASYVVFGKASGFSEVQLSLLDGDDGFRISGAAAGDLNGYGVRAAGDVNGDGYGDVIVGSYASSANGYQSGAAYVVFGKAAGGFASNLDLSALSASDGFRIVGGAAGDMAGYAVGGAGDVNGDGYDDLIIGAPGAGGDRAGSSYVVLGKSVDFWNSVDFSGTIDLLTIGGSDGFRLSGVASGDDSGYAVGGAGDINGDGFDDMMVASAHASPQDLMLAGESYVIFGGKLVTGPETYLGGTGDDTLTGNPAGVDQTFIGGQGNDTMFGNGGKDAFSGGAGDDTMHLGLAGQSTIDFVKINGGSGFDTLVLDGSGVTLDLTASGADRLESIERIDLAGNGNNNLVLDIRDLLNMSESSNTLQIGGDAGDAVHVRVDFPPTLWTDNGMQGSYHSYSQGLANLLVDPDVAVSFS